MLHGSFEELCQGENCGAEARIPPVMPLPIHTVPDLAAPLLLQHPCQRFGKAVKTAQSLGQLPLTQEIWKKLLASGFCLTQT